LSAIVGGAEMRASSTGIVCTPLRSERAALWRAVRAPVIRTGMGPKRRIDAEGPVLVAGVAGALADWLRPGDLVVADELRSAERTAACHAAPLLFGAVGRLGLRVHLGPLLSQERVGYGTHLAAAAACGALAVDTESAYLAAQAPPGQTVALRAIVDTPSRPLLSPGTLWRGIAGLRALRAAAPAVDEWACAVANREITVARTDSVATLAEQCDLVVRDVGDLDLRSLAGARRVGIVADGRHQVDELVRCLSGLGGVGVN
jgi:4-hydroxy-3-methylbut-2-enyl diphosphate reductase